jgi:adenylate cyclase
MIGIIDWRGVAMASGHPEAVTTQRLDGLGRWLVEVASHRSIEELFSEFCRELVRRDLPIWRGSLLLEVLHPEVSGLLHVWTDERTVIHESVRANAVSEAYLNSPVRIVDETHVPFRRRLDAPAPDLPLLDELREMGATDYVIFPLPFLDRSRTAAIAFATRESDGFTKQDLHELQVASRLLSPYAERHVLRRIAIDLLDTYVGPRTGRRIIEGRVDRGAVDLIEAAIWFTDLRGYTHLSETLPISAVIADLNAWFEVVGTVVDAHGGEILKFIGDAVLAIFPTSAEKTRESACADALAAAEDFFKRSHALNGERRATGRVPFASGLALHFGEVAYGNVGAPRRLDFTVIGPAVNLASRLQELSKALDRRVVISKAFTQCLGNPFVDLGLHRLRGVEHLQEVFTLP